MAEITVSQSKSSTTTLNTNKKSWFSKFFSFFRTKSNDCCSQTMNTRNKIILEWTSRLLSKSELDLILQYLPEDSYQTNANKSIYSLKKTGKPFYIDFDGYNYDIYSHQTISGNGIYNCDKYLDLMYTLRTTVFCGLTACQTTRKQLEYILKAVPKSYYEVNVNQTIYSFKKNGKPFFIDKSHCNFEQYECPTEELVPHIKLINNITEETDINYGRTSSEILGKQYAERNRLVFIELKSREKDSKQRLNGILRSNGLKLRDNTKENLSSKQPVIITNGDCKPEKDITQKWNNYLSKRKVYQKSDLMIRTISSKEAKHILNKCKESLFDWNERNERRKRVEIRAMLSPVINNCDLLQQKLYAICEVIEPNDVNHNPSD